MLSISAPTIANVRISLRSRGVYALAAVTAAGAMPPGLGGHDASVPFVVGGR